MVNRRKFLAFLGVGAATLAGGGMLIALLPDSEKKTEGPPEIAYGSDSCAHCRMIISDARFAAGWRDASADETHFDDIGCMVNHAREHPPAQPVQFWVHNYNTEEWLDASLASFIIDPSIKTPMSYGIAAAGSPEDAKSLAPEGDVTGWAGLPDVVEAKGYACQLQPTKSIQ
ncbi:MAG: nitrous oxide reductase accessory protein NosL [Tepidiformaceae bacterium]